jgi:hypothetical protein
MELDNRQEFSRVLNAVNQYEDVQGIDIFVSAALKQF